MSQNKAENRKDINGFEAVAQVKDEVCGECEGRKWNPLWVDGRGKLKVLCVFCRGTGKRTDSAPVRRMG